DGHIGADEGDGLYLLLGDVLGVDRCERVRDGNRIEAVLIEIGRAQCERSGAGEDGRYLAVFGPRGERLVEGIEETAHDGDTTGSDQLIGLLGDGAGV